MFPVMLMLLFPPNCTLFAFVHVELVLVQGASYKAMYWNKLASDANTEGSEVVAGADVGAVIVRVPPPFVSIVAPGSRMRVTPAPVNAEPPLRVRVPDMKYTPAVSDTAVLPFVVTPLFVHLVVAV
jgi:hypothetical protein